MQKTSQDREYVFNSIFQHYILNSFLQKFHQIHENIALSEKVRQISDKLKLKEVSKCSGTKVMVFLRLMIFSE